MATKKAYNAKKTNLKAYMLKRTKVEYTGGYRSASPTPGQAQTKSQGVSK